MSTIRALLLSAKISNFTLARSISIFNDISCANKSNRERWISTTVSSIKWSSTISSNRLTRSNSIDSSRWSIWRRNKAVMTTYSKRWRSNENRLIQAMRMCWKSPIQSKGLRDLRLMRRSYSIELALCLFGPSGLAPRHLVYISHFPLHSTSFSSRSIHATIIWCLHQCSHNCFQ